MRATHREDASDRPDESDAAATDRATAAHDCPLCSLTAATRSDVYGHLLVEHRKSAISAALVGHERPEARDGADAGTGGGDARGTED